MPRPDEWVRSRLILALALAGALTLDGCASYPAGVPLGGQDDRAARRDQTLCRDFAQDEVPPPILVAIGKKVGFAVLGAVVGAGLVVGSSQASASGDTREGDSLAIAAGIGAAAGFVVGSIVGTYKGSEETFRGVRARENVYARCMTERGYEIPGAPPLH